VQEASACIEDILSRGLNPIVVGGTGLYIDSLLSGRTFAADSAGPLRRQLSKRYEQEGGEALLAALEAVDRRAPENFMRTTKSASSERWRSISPPEKPLRSTTTRHGGFRRNTRPAKSR
jgi:tRNA A37 N6-isopentenylltransferase MiaA